LVFRGTKKTVPHSNKKYRSAQVNEMSKDNNYSSYPSRGRSDDPPRQQGDDQRGTNSDASPTQEGVDLARAENTPTTGISTLLLAIMDSSLLAIRASSSQRSARSNSLSAPYFNPLATNQQHIIDLMALIDGVLGLLDDDQHPTAEQ
jgi:hypothetical protein